MGSDGCKKYVLKSMFLVMYAFYSVSVPTQKSLLTFLQQIFRTNLILSYSVPQSML